MQTVLITGANRGLGLEFVRQYAADGWQVHACCRAPAHATALNALADKHPAHIHLHALDVADHVQIDRLANALSTQAVDVLINNAGIYADTHDSRFGHTDYAAWADAFRINSMAPLKMAEAFHRHLLRGKARTIATITSKMGSIADNGSGGNYLYRSSKTAVNMVVKSLALDLAKDGIKAVLLHPGWVLTDMGGPNALITPEQSVTGMRGIIANLHADDSGSFFAYDGKAVPW